VAPRGWCVPAVIAIVSSGCKQVLGISSEPLATDALIDTPARDAENNDAAVDAAMGPPRCIDHGAELVNNSTSVSVTLDVTPAIGDVELAVLDCTSGTTGAIQNPEDQRGTYRLLTLMNDGNGAKWAVYAETIANTTTPNTVTVMVARPSTCQLLVAVYEDVGSASAIDGAPSISSGDSATAMGSLSTTQAGDVIVGFVVAGVQLTAGSGYTVEDSGTGILIEDRVAATAGMYSANAALASAGDWGLALVAVEGP
jgi:hypothetical protein